MNATLQASYPWVNTPLVVCAPMLRISLAPLAVAVSRAGGFGFLSGGYAESDLDNNLQQARSLVQESNPPIPHKEGVLPIGVGFITYGVQLSVAVDVVKKYTPAAIWLFAPYKLADLGPWADNIRAASDGKTQVWVQIGNAEQALEVARICKPDVLVVQGSDSGGHGLKQSASVIAILPEVSDLLAEEGFGNIPILAAGGIVEGRGMAAAIALGANGVVMGTRFLAAKEARIAKGYQDEVLRAKDGAINTVRTTIYDSVRGMTSWPAEYDGRGVVNESYRDDQRGMPIAENKQLYEEALKLGDKGWGPEGRATTYAGAGVGLVKKVLPAADIVKEVAEGAQRALEKATSKHYS